MAARGSRSSTPEPGFGSAEANVPLLVLPEHRLAYTALQRLLQPRSRGGNRLVYVYGPAGIGKTHLVRAFLKTLRANEPNAVVLHVTASEFAAEFAEASESGTVPEFQRRYRNLETLICEDVQSLQKRRQTQQQLIAILDAITAEGGRVILTATRLPGELQGFDPRLVSRCRGGVTAGIESLSRTSRAKLIAHFAASKQMPMPAPAIDVLAHNDAPPRVLLACVGQLDQLSRTEKLPISDELVRRFLERESPEGGVSLPEITKAVARQFGVPMKDVRGEKRAAGQVLPRQCAMFLARELTKESLTSIAAFFGRKNHSTVTHACRRIEFMSADSPTLRQQLARIRGDLAAGGR